MILDIHQAMRESLGFDGMFEELASEAAQDALTALDTASDGAQGNPDSAKAADLKEEAFDLSLPPAASSPRPASKQMSIKFSAAPSDSETRQSAAGLDHGRRPSRMGTPTSAAASLPPASPRGSGESTSRPPTRQSRAATPGSRPISPEGDLPELPPQPHLDVVTAMAAGDILY